MAKAALWNVTDAETRKLGERSRLDTCVVLALNACLLDAGPTDGGNDQFSTTNHRTLHFCIVCNLVIGIWNFPPWVGSVS